MPPHLFLCGGNAPTLCVGALAPTAPPIPVPMICSYALGRGQTYHVSHECTCYTTVEIIIYVANSSIPMVITPYSRLNATGNCHTYL